MSLTPALLGFFVFFLVLGAGCSARSLDPGLTAIIGLLAVWLTILPLRAVLVPQELGATPLTRIDDVLIFDAALVLLFVVLIFTRLVPPSPQAALRRNFQAPTSAAVAVADDEREDYQEVIKAVFGEFCTMLAGIAGDEPLLLALDHLHAMVDFDLQNYVVPLLLDSLGQRDMANVHAVLIDRPDQMKQLRRDSRLTLPAALEIKKFCRGEIRRLGGDYCAHLELLPIRPEVQGLLAALAVSLPDFDGRTLENILGIVTKAAH